MDGRSGPNLSVRSATSIVRKDGGAMARRRSGRSDATQSLRVLGPCSRARVVGGACRQLPGSGPSRACAQTFRVLAWSLGLNGWPGESPFRGVLARSGRTAGGEVRAADGGNIGGSSAGWLTCCGGGVRTGAPVAGPGWLRLRATFGSCGGGLAPRTSCRARRRVSRQASACPGPGWTFPGGGLHQRRAERRGGLTTVTMSPTIRVARSVVANGVSRALAV